jgi:hypothetical protein
MSLNNGLDGELMSVCVKSAAEMTDQDLAVLESWDPKVAREYRDDRARAVQKVLRAREQEDAAAAKAAERQPTAQSFLTVERWAKNRDAIVEMLTSMVDRLVKMNERNAARNEKIAALEKRCAELESAQRAESQLKFVGIWAQGAEYHRGNFATWGGSLFHCNVNGTRDKPGTSPDWTLCVKKGADGRDGKDASQ